MKKAMSILSLFFIVAVVAAACTPTDAIPEIFDAVQIADEAEYQAHLVPVQVPLSEYAAQQGIPNGGNHATLRVSWWGGDARQEAMQAALELYMDRYPHITVVSEFGTFSGWMDNLLSQLDTQDEPDIMQVNYSWIHSFGEGSNVFADLNDWAHIIDLTNWTSELLSFTNTSDGQLAGVSHGTVGRVIIYNRHMLEEFELEEFPTTIDELIEFGKRVSVHNAALDAGDNTYAFFPIGPESLDIILLQLLYNETGRIIEENGRMLHTRQEVQAAFEIIGRMIEFNTIPTFEQQEPPHDATNPVWTQGRGGSAFEWVHNLFISGGNFMDGDLDGLGVALFPAATEGGRQLIMQRPSLVYTMSRNSNYPEAAAHLLNFLFTDEDALKAIGSHLGIAMFRDGMAVDEMLHLTQGLVLEGRKLLEANMAPMGATFEEPALRGPRFAIMEAFRLGSIDASEAAERFLREQQAALDEMGR